MCTMLPTQPERSHLLPLAQACLLRLRVDEDYGHGLAMDGKRPFGSSLRAVVVAEVFQIIGLPCDEVTPAHEAYARQLWDALPDFIAGCQLVDPCAKP